MFSILYDLVDNKNFSDIFSSSQRDFFIFLILTCPSIFKSFLCNYSKNGGLFLGLLFKTFYKGDQSPPLPFLRNSGHRF